jgi:hypothetical protein
VLAEIIRLRFQNPQVDLRELFGLSITHNCELTLVGY